MPAVMQGNQIYRKYFCLMDIVTKSNNLFDAFELVLNENCDSVIKYKHIMILGSCYWIYPSRKPSLYKKKNLPSKLRRKKNEKYRS